MSTQTIEKSRISEDPDNFRKVFDSAGSTVEAVRTGDLEASEATAMARNDTIRQKMLDSDIKGRLVDHRLRAKQVASQQQQHRIGDDRAA